jgi:hypothetical protein
MIIRRRHTKNFTTVSNVMFDDEKLKADEVGILIYLLSRPDNWEVRRPALQRRWNVGPVAMKRIVRSWMKNGWCQATKVRLPNGHFCILYDISDIPGKGLSDDEITEALSLVSSEALSDVLSEITEPEDEPPHILDDPPPCQPVLADHPVVTRGVAYIRDITNTDLTNLESPNSEREFARAREKHALNLAEFKRRWPTAASDDQTRIDDAWYALEFDEGEAALAGIVAFLEKLKRDKRTTVPAGWKYLKEKRWTLLEHVSVEAKVAGYPCASVEGRAVAVLYDIVGAGDFFRTAVRKADRVYYRLPVTPRLAALAQAPSAADWATLARNQAAAWESFVAEHLTLQVRQRVREGSRAPWPWPPRKDGALTATGPPDVLMSDDDLADFK